MDGEERRDGRAAGRQRLEDQRRVEAGHAAAAVLLADVDRRHAERRRLAQDVDREMLGLVPVERVGRDALIGEGFGHVADGEMVCGQREHELALLFLRADRPQCPTFAPAAIRPAIIRGRARPRPALIFRLRRGKHGGDRSRRPRTFDATSLFCFQRAALCLQADCVERKEGIMVRFVRLLAAAALAGRPRLGRRCTGRAAGGRAAWRPDRCSQGRRRRRPRRRNRARPL